MGKIKETTVKSLYSVMVALNIVIVVFYFNDFSEIINKYIFSMGFLTSSIITIFILFIPSIVAACYMGFYQMDIQEKKDKLKSNANANLKR